MPRVQCEAFFSDLIEQTMTVNTAMHNGTEGTTIVNDVAVRIAALTLVQKTMRIRDLAYDMLVRCVIIVYYNNCICRLDIGIKFKIK